jgi:hypothetical protein
VYCCASKDVGTLERHFVRTVHLFCDYEGTLVESEILSEKETYMLPAAQLVWHGSARQQPTKRLGPSTQAKKLPPLGHDMFACAMLQLLCTDLSP